MTLVQRLRRLLDDRGYSIREAAQAAGMEVQQLRRIVAGRTANPGVETVRRIVEAVGGTMGELFNEEETRSQEGRHHQPGGHHVR